MNKNVRKNYIFNLIFQLFQIIIPIIVTPYISRVLLSDGVGKYSFSYSIANYFIILATFGFTYYAQREIAKHIGNKEEQTKIFWEIYILKIFTTIVSIGVYLVLIFTNVFESYNQVLLIMIFNIIAVGLDASYMLQGNENFQKTVTSNISVRILSIISIFVFVKTREDLWIYALINSITPVIANCLIFLFSSKYLTKIKVNALNIKKHFVPALKLFIPTIAISVYALLDKTLIGVMLPAGIADSAVGHYDSAEKIAKIALTVVTSLSAVMIPNNAKHFAQKDYTQVRKNIESAMQFSMFLGFPVMFGLMAVAENFVPWFFGGDFMAAIPLLMVLSILVISIGLNNVYGIQYLVATNKENIFTISVTIGALTNLVLNIITIPYLGAMGAALATVIAETVILIYQMIYLRKEFSILKTLKNTIKFLISGMIMFVAVWLVSKQLVSSMLNTLLLVLIGMVVYMLTLLILREKFVLQILNKIKNSSKVKSMKQKIKKILYKMPLFKNLRFAAGKIKFYTIKGVYTGSVKKNVVKYLLKFKKLDIENYKNYNIKYRQTEDKNFYYYIDPCFYVPVKENEIIAGNFSLDYRLILNNSLNELKEKYPENKAIDLMIAENGKIQNLLNNEQKEMFKNMINNKCESFKSALQRILFVNQIVWQTGHSLNGFGRLDVVLNQYYETDLKNKVMTIDNAKELLKEFFLILHRDYRVKSASLLGDTGQIIVLGGLNEDGTYLDTKITRLILEVLTELNIPDPKILLRISKKMPKDLLKFAIECISKGSGSPLLSNDDVIVENMIKFGYDKSGSYNYAAAACWEVYPWGDSAEMCHFKTVNCVEPLNRVCQEQKFHSLDELVAQYKEALIADFSKFVELAEVSYYKNDPMMALMVNEEKNKNIVDSKYLNYGILTVGLSNAVNALLNIQKYVYEDKSYTIAEMLKNLEDNTFRSKLKADNDKFGEDKETVVNLTKDLMSCLAEYCREYNKTHKHKIKTSYSSPAYIDQGKITGASLDGRKNGEPFNVHISCSRPLAYTELINFASKLDYSEPVLNGNVIDFSTTPELISKNIDKFTQLIWSSISLGFYQMQVNVVSSAQLIEAKKNPEKFPNLIVRVWGFSAYFNDLSEEYKDLLIERTKMYEDASK